MGYMYHTQFKWRVIIFLFAPHVVFYLFIYSVCGGKQINVPPSNPITWHIIVIFINLINELVLILLIMYINDLNIINFTYPIIIKSLKMFDWKLPNIKFNHGTNASVSSPKVFATISSSLCLKLKENNWKITSTKVRYCNSLA
jgi:hypothetical protein